MKLGVAILRAGLIVGTLDWMGAVGVYMLRGGSGPEKVFIFIASAILGERANAMEQWIPYLGFGMHYCIAYSWTILFFIAYPRVAVMRSNPWLVGLGYGILIWVIMNLIVLPMTLVVPRPFTVSSVAIGASVLVICIGVPLAYLARRHYRSA